MTRRKPSEPRATWSWPLGCLFGLAATVGMVSFDASGAERICSARSGPTMAPLVELYTSEGCSSCPPADRWLSALKNRPEVVALAFHVDYWDRLGWKDRFASAAYTQRQLQQQSVNGARFAYTPQVVVNGRDRKDWPRSNGLADGVPASVGIELVRDGERVIATVSVTGDAGPRLAAYWALTESGHRTAVKAGENDGATLDHDFVVRDYRPMPAWDAARGTSQTLGFTLAPTSDATHPRRVNLVVIDAASGRPLQALALGC